MGKLQFHTVEPRADVWEDLSARLKKINWQKRADRQTMVSQGKEKNEEVCASRKGGTSDVGLRPPNYLQGC